MNNLLELLRSWWQEEEEIAVENEGTEDRLNNHDL